MNLLSLLLLVTLVVAKPALALPGFFVGADETPIAVPSTKIILSTHNGHQVMTVLPSIASDKQDLTLLLPVPSTVTKENIKTLDTTVFDALDKLSAPRLVETTDMGPCPMTDNAVPPKTITSATYNTPQDATVDISILPATDAASLPEWLTKNGYKLPPKADQIITPYTQRKMAFVIAKIHRSSSDKGILPPIQISYDAPQMVLPIRLGLVNAPKPVVAPPAVKEIHVLHAAPDMTAPHENNTVDLFNDDAQALTLYVLTQHGMAASPMMRSVMLGSARSDVVLPAFAKDNFTAISDAIKMYRAKAESNAMIIEFAGTADVPDAVLQSVGVSWLNETPATAAPTAYPAADENNLIGGMMLPKAAYPNHARAKPAALATNGKAYLTRLYLRYSPNTLPQDLLLQESSALQSIAATYHVEIPWTPDADPKKAQENKCDGAALYQQSLATRDAHAAETLKHLTGLSAESFHSESFHSENSHSKPAPPAVK